ncbi:HipA domain-containing protein [Bdellovibrionota bacterium FG-1]
MNNKRCFKCLQPIAGAQSRYGLHEACFLTWFKLKQPAEFVSLVRQSTESREPTLPSPAIDPAKGFISSFFHGKFRKYSADLAGDSYILKVHEKKAPELPEVEYLCNQIGQALGLPIADHYLIELFGDRTFVTKNFIRRGGGSSNLTHIYHYFQADQAYSCASLLQIIQQETKRPYDLEVFIHTCLFDALIGNHDRHGRNLAFVITPQRVSLSPVYDNTSYLGLESGEFLRADFDPRGKIFTERSREPTMYDYVVEFSSCGFADHVKTFTGRINEEKIQAVISESFCSNLMKGAISKLIAKRIQELKDATRNGF